MSRELIWSYLQAKSHTHGHLRLTEAEAHLFCPDFGAAQFKLLGEDGRSVHGRTLLQNALPLTRSVLIEYEFSSNGSGGASPAGRSEHVYAERTPASLPVGAPAPRLPTDSKVPMGGATDEGFIREFDRLERNRKDGFMAAGFVVNTLLPQLGLSVSEARLYLSRLDAEGIVTLTKVPSLKNPETQATRVRLNREHPRVKAALSVEEPPSRRSRRLIKLPPGSEPLSETVIRERR